MVPRTPRPCAGTSRSHCLLDGLQLGRRPCGWMLSKHLPCAQLGNQCRCRGGRLDLEIFFQPSREIVIRQDGCGKVSGPVQGRDEPPDGLLVVGRKRASLARPMRGERELALRLLGFRERERRIYCPPPEPGAFRL